jgi:hypothetical protein
MEGIKTQATLEIEREDADPTELRIADFDSAAIQRLVSEVSTNEPTGFARGYNRTHNRHNR